MKLHRNMLRIMCGTYCSNKGIRPELVNERVNERILVLTYVNGSLHSVSLALLDLAEIIALAWTTLGHEPRERSERK